jgi:anti-sigma B factor antagonist
VERPSGAAPPRQPGGRSESEAANGQLLTVRVESAGPDAAVVSLTGELDLSTIPRIESQLFEQLRSHPGVVVDLTQLSFIDSSGIGLLIKAFRAVDDGGKLHTVIAPGSQVERVFRLAGIDRALPLFVERTRALESLNATARD